MKNIRLISVLLLLINISANSQTRIEQKIEDFKLQSQYAFDSLYLDLSLADNDSSRSQALNNLWLQYYEYNVDSALFYLDELIELHRHQGFRSAEARHYLNKGYLYMYKGAYDKSLEYMLKGQSILEDPKTKVDLIGLSTYPNNTDNEIRLIQKNEVKRYLGSLFLRVGNYGTSLSNLKEATKLAERLGDIDNLFYGKIIIARDFQELNELDSALATIDEALSLEISDIAYNWSGTALTIKASIQFKQNIYREAEITYIKALETNLSNQNYNYAARAQNGLAELYLHTHLPDKALEYAFNAIESAKVFSTQYELANAYAVISGAYAAKNNVDSAYHYLYSANAIKDSLQNIEKENISKFNAALLDENLRNKDLEVEREVLQSRRRTYGLIAALLVFLIIAFLLYRNNRQKQKANELLQNQKDEINMQKHKAENALDELKSTQAQLIQSEKMASLGELTAGIAHEIQNPLNFVNNFSEVSREMVEELKAERQKVKGDRDQNLENEILEDIDENLNKIHHHGQRASGIVKGMLEHSRAGDGAKEPTDLNALADEYLRLAYHGLRAKDKSFNADFKTELDPSLPKVNVIPQDIGRVLLNLINNAFFAVNQKANRHSERSDESEDYQPKVVVSTRQCDGKIEISVKDNGSGISTKIKDKIFQPFFTTKPTGSGTGLGLSLSYDIVKAHGGEIKVGTNVGEGSEFIIQMPI